MLLETVCQKLESLVVPVFESPPFQAIAAGIIEKSMIVGIIKVNADRVFSPEM